MKVMQELEGGLGAENQQNNQEFFNLYNNNKSQIRLLSYNGAIISLYGSWEKFIRDIFMKYFFLCDPINVDKFKTKYIDKTFEYLLKKEDSWKKTEDYHDFLLQLIPIFNGNLNNVSKEIFFKNYPNYRINTVEKIFNILDLNDLKNKISQDETLVEHLRSKHGEELNNLSGETRYKKAYDILDDLVERRNAIAHGKLEDSRLSHTELCSYAEYIISISESILNFMFCNHVMIYKEMYPTITFKEKFGSTVGLFTAIDGMKIGSIVLEIANNETFKLLKIESMQDNGNNITAIDNQNEISLKFNKKYSPERTLKFIY